MKRLIYILIFLFALGIFYLGALFLGFNLPGSTLVKNKGISGNAVLEVKLVMDNKNQDPIANVEVDVAEKPGPPPEGGIAATNASGIAIFHLKPGNYSVYFNDNTFPKNLTVPQTQVVTVTPEGPNQLTIKIDTQK